MRAWGRSGLAVGLALGALVVPARAQAGPDLRARLEAFVRARAEDPPARIELPELAEFENVLASAPGARVSLSAHPRTAMSGSVPITVVVHDDQRELRRGTVTAQVEVERLVLVAARAMPRGARVGPEDLREERRSVRGLGSGLIRSRDALIGKRTLRPVAEGTAWRQGFVQTATLVSRGDRVRLVLEHGPLRIEAHGKAREDAGPGDSVRVLNLDSRREVVGRVAPDGAVHVAF